MSRNGLAMVFPYPFFAGVLAAVAGVGAFAGRACGSGGAISAVIWNVNVWTARFLSSCFDSRISTFWKYPDRFSAVIKFATALIEAEDPSIASEFPLRVICVSHRF